MTRRSTIPRFRGRVLDLLLEANENQVWLAGRLRMRPSSLHRILGGERSLSTTMGHVPRMAQALGVDVQQLLFDTELAAPPPGNAEPAYVQRNRAAMLAASLAILAGLRAGRYRDPAHPDDRFAWVLPMGRRSGRVSYRRDGAEPPVEVIPIIVRDWDGHDARDADSRLARFVSGTTGVGWVRGL